MFEIIRWTHPHPSMSMPDPLVEELEAAA
jgi:hypothetical protein